MKSRVFALVDCNNFFVSCERVFRPDLWDKPVVVMSGNDGCIVARSNEVKALGVGMAVPVFQVRDILDEHAVTRFSANFALYGDFSQRVVQVLRQACPSLEVYSVDESFLDLSSMAITDYTAWAQRLKQTIMRWTGIPVSIGVAPTKTLAKAAAEYAKKTAATYDVYSLVPDQLVSGELAWQRHQELLGWLPVEAVWGIGWRSAPRLRQLGISTAADLTEVSDGWAQQQLSIRGLHTVRELRGQSQLHVAERSELQQSIMHTRSFGHTVRRLYELEGAVATFTARAAAKLREQQEVARTLLVFLRTTAGSVEGRGASLTIPLLPPTADTGVLLETALAGLHQIHDPELGYKKAGIVLGGLVSDKAQQLSLLQPDTGQLDRRQQLMAVVDQLNQRHRTRVVQHAAEYLGAQQWRGKQLLRSPAYTTSWGQLRRVK